MLRGDTTPEGWDQKGVRGLLVVVGLAAVTLALLVIMFGARLAFQRATRTRAVSAVISGFTGAGAAIPDNDSRGVVVLGAGIGMGSGPPRLLQDATIYVNIVHPRPADLAVSLIHPDGTQVLLRKPGDNSGFSTRSDHLQTLRYPGTGPAAGPLATLHGRPPYGVWNLRVQDLKAGKVGRVVGWGGKLVY
jgi:subtilisin-like proprotein convertase family protein